MTGLPPPASRHAGALRPHAHPFRRAALALLLGFALAPAAAGASLKPGRPAPTFTLPTAAGPVSLDSLRGRVVLVDFWASWCVPCRGSFPWMRNLQKRYAADGLAIVAVNLDKDSTAAARFLEDVPAPFTIAYDPAGRTAEAYKVAAMPTSFLVGRDGTILESHAGFDPKKTGALEARIQEACKR